MRGVPVACLLTRSTLCMMVVASIAACRAASHGVAPDGGMAPDPDAGIAPRVVITMTVGSTRFVTREHMLAAGEMQIPGEPLAEAMGRDLGAYSRDFVPADVYHDATLDRLWVDI